MLSICIPIYNLDVTLLAESLFEQAGKLAINYEIIFIDDCSEPAFKEKNRPVCERAGKYIELEKNVGRAKIRNLFLQFSTYDYLLFMDCDSVLISDSFLKKYVDEIHQASPLIICGGRVYSKEKPPKEELLNWKYGTLKESQPAKVRMENSNKSFMTNNFVIHRKLLDEIRFDERLTRYGHEDTLFGFQLKKRGVQIRHIENPVLHGELDDNLNYLVKNEFGIINLIHIAETLNFDEEFIADVTLLKFYKKLKRLKLENFIANVFRLVQHSLKKRLSEGHVNLMLFDFYKIGYLCQQLKREK